MQHGFISCGAAVHRPACQTPARPRPFPPPAVGAATASTGRGEPSRNCLEPNRRDSSPYPEAGRESPTQALADGVRGLAAVILAAGGARRMGRDKLALPWRGKSLLGWVVEAALALEPVVLVGDGAGSAGPTPFAAAVTADAAPPTSCPPAYRGVTRLPAPEGVPGLAASLKAGLAALPPDVAGAMVLLGDMPLVTQGLVLRLAADFRPGRFLAPRHGGRRGNPVVIPATFFPEIMTLEGDAGARSLLQRPGTPVDFVDLEDPAVLFDVDTPEDYDRLLELT